MRLLPRMASEPPAGYVAFVAQHLERLRRDATRVVGDEGGADALYPEVLTDVAVRWRWLELLRTRLGLADAADRYLHRAFARRSEHWRADRSAAGEVVEIQVWRSHAPPPVPPPVWSNAATRLAPYVRPTVRADFSPICEAAVAWWHAYEARRRRRIVAGVVAAVFLVVWVAHLQQQAGVYGLAALPGAVLGLATRSVAPAPK